MQTYKTISAEEADALYACGVTGLEYQFSGVTVSGTWIEWARFNTLRTICHKPSDVDWALAWRVPTDE